MQTDKRKKKVSITENILSKIDNAKSIVITDYRGMTTLQLLDLRQKLQPVDGEFTITKNTLLGRALRTKGLAVDQDLVAGPSACLLAYGDEVAPLKVLSGIAKTTLLPKIKGGYLGSDSLTAQQVINLALLPSKEVLLGKVVGTINSPLYGLVTALQGNIRNLVYALHTISEKQMS